MGSYSIIIYANEYGQPKGQDLADGDPVSILYLYYTFITSVFNGVQVTHVICTFRCILNEWIYYQIP
jgi:hypothetical protein